MSRERDEELESLQRSLERLGGALGRPGSSSAPTAEPPAGSGMRRTGQAGLGLAVLLAAAAIATGHLALLAPAVVLAVIAGALTIRTVGDFVAANLPAGLAPRDPSRPHIGMGATVAGDAQIAPGATVEMGATVVGARLAAGAVVRMGATVSRGAVLEEGAVVSWGADVGPDAVIGRGAVVGAGATIVKGAYVPAGTWVMPGSTWSAGRGTGTVSERTPEDPRTARIDAAYARIVAELREAPESVRGWLGESVEGLAGLRETCHTLSIRERALREESSPKGLAWLDQERASLEQRIADTRDPEVKRSLTSAVAAIEDQKRQREQLGQSAERLDAELTRMVWTLEGMAAQLVRLRTAGQGAAAPGEVLGSVRQLHDEIDAIADALEEVARPAAQPVRTR